MPGALRKAPLTLVFARLGGFPATRLVAGDEVRVDRPRAPASLLGTGLLAEPVAWEGEVQVASCLEVGGRRSASLAASRVSPLLQHHAARDECDRDSRRSRARPESRGPEQRDPQMPSARPARGLTPRSAPPNRRSRRDHEPATASSASSSDTNARRAASRTRRRPRGERAGDRSGPRCTVRYCM